MPTSPARRSIWAWAPGAGAVLLFAVLAEALARTRGHYKTNRVIFVTLALAAYAASRPWSGRARQVELGLRRQLCALLLMGGALLVQDLRLLYVQVSWAEQGLRFVIVLSLIASAGLAVLVWRARVAGARQALLLLVLCALVVARVLVLVASPQPHIDVFTTTDAAVDYLLSGLNPYAQTYPDIYGGQYDYAPGMAYWPGTVLFAAAGKLAFGDLRATYVLGDLLCAAALYTLAVRGARRGHETGLLAAAVWLAFPVSLFIIEQAWVDPIVLAALLWAAVALHHERFFTAGLLLGVATAIKQPAALAALGAAVLVLGLKPKAGLRLVAGGLLAGVALIGPFVVWDAEGLFRMTVTVPMVLDLRLDALTFLALAKREWGLDWPGALSAIMYGVGLMGLLLSLGRAGRRDGRAAPAWRWLPAMALLYGLVFLFGKQAFCNYWALCAGLVLAAHLASPAPSDTEPLYG